MNAEMLTSPTVAIPAIISIMMVVYFVGRLTGLIENGQKVFYVEEIFDFILGIPDFLIGLISKPLVKLPLFLRMQDRWNDKLSAESIRRWLDNYYADEKHHKNDPKLKGDRLAIAREKFPEEDYPYLYRHCPDDLLPEMIIDGHLPNGELPAPVLAPCHIDYQFVSEVAKFAIKSGAILALCSFIAWYPIKNMLVPAAVKSANINVQVDNEIHHDVWSQAEMLEIRKAQGEETAALAKARVDDVLSGLPKGILSSLLLMLLASTAIFKSVLSEGGSKLVKPLTHMFKDSTSRYKSRLDQVINKRRAYIKQLEIAAIDKSPMIPFGVASGTFRFRGVLGAYERGAPAQISLMDATAGVWVSGLTNSGKTSTIAKPTFKRFLEIRADAIKRGEPRYLSLVIGDGKDTLRQELEPMIIAAGQGDDIRRIGCEEGVEYGVDLYDNITPDLAGDILMMKMTQGSGDPIWGKAGSNFLKKAGKIIWAAELTPWGYKYLQTYGERVKSLITHYKICMSPALQDEAIAAIREAIATGVYYPGFAEEVNAELDMAIEYVETTFRNLATETSSSVLFNIDASLSDFTMHGPLCRQFATGGAEKLITIPEFWGTGGGGGGLTILSLSDLEDGGEAAKVVSIFITTLMKAEARKREMADPHIRFKERNILFWDEFQTIATKGSALSDAEFCLVNRSTGLSYFVLSQSLTALENVMGDVAARNFAMQMRGAKIMLATEDVPTIQMMCQLSGETMRLQVYKSDHYESFEAMCVEHRTSLRQIISKRARLSAEYQSGRPIRDAFRALRFISKAPAPIEFETNTLPVKFDGRFVHSNCGQEDVTNQTISGLKSLTGGIAGFSDPALAGSLQAAHWRHEDKLSEWMKEGIHREPVLKTEDITNLGNNALMVLRRAGDLRQDIIYL